MSYEVFDGVIESEYRIYVLNKKIIDSHCYSGSFEVIPDFNYVRSIIEENNDFPISYTIDIGILDNGKNVVVEFNDMWAIGNYGVPNDLYIRMLKERYFEITGGFKYEK